MQNRAEQECTSSSQDDSVDGQDEGNGKEQRAGCEIMAGFRGLLMFSSCLPSSHIKFSEHRSVLNMHFKSSMECAVGPHT